MKHKEKNIPSKDPTAITIVKLLGNLLGTLNNFKRSKGVAINLNQTGGGGQRALPSIFYFIAF